MSITPKAPKLLAFWAKVGYIDSMASEQQFLGLSRILYSFVGPQLIVDGLILF